MSSNGKGQARDGMYESRREGRADCRAEETKNEGKGRIRGRNGGMEGETDGWCRHMKEETRLREGETRERERGM